MLKSLFISLFVCLLTLTFAQTNTILIIADDLGSDYFGFYENDGDTVDVPNIRRLMKAGVKFTNMMSNPVCSATRSSILTGRYGFRTGVGGIVGGEGGKILGSKKKKQPHPNTNKLTEPITIYK